MGTQKFTADQIAHKMLVFKKMVKNGDKTESQYQNLIDNLYFIFGYDFMYEATDKAKEMQK